MGLAAVILEQAVKCLQVTVQEQLQVGKRLQSLQLSLWATLPQLLLIQEQTELLLLLRKPIQDYLLTVTAHLDSVAPTMGQVGKSFQATVQDQGRVGSL